MLIYHTSYYANFYICSSTLIHKHMMDKKLIYKQIKMLQSFRIAYDKTQEYKNQVIYEVTKLWKDENMNLQKSIEFVAVPRLASIPIFVGFGVFDISVRLLDNKTIDMYVSRCNSYGI